MYDFQPYSLLRISSTATTKEIKTAYRQFIRKVHPDKNDVSRHADAHMIMLTCDARSHVMLKSTIR
jgi:curved DNA-binding protein CbpA